MATGKNVLSTLHENIWRWQWMKGIAEMSCCHNCTLHIRTFAHLEKMTNKVSTRCQQGVNKVSTRCKICNQRPREKMRSHLICLLFVVRKSSLYLCLYLQFVFGGRDEVQKKIDILKKWRGGKKKQNVGLIRDQSNNMCIT